MYKKWIAVVLVCMIALSQCMLGFAGDITMKYTNEEIAKGIEITSPAVIQTTANNSFLISIGMEKAYSVSMELYYIEVVGSNMLKELPKEDAKKIDDLKSKKDDKKDVKKDDPKKEDPKKEDSKANEKLIRSVEDLSQSKGFKKFIFLDTIENAKPGYYKMVFVRKDNNEVVKEYKFTLQIKETLTETEIKNGVKTSPIIEVKK